MQTRGYGYVLLVVVALLAAVPVTAAEWVFCDACATDAQFATAAKSRVGTSTGEFTIHVGNTLTGRLHLVVVASRRDGQMPYGNTPIESTAAHTTAGSELTERQARATGADTPQGTVYQIVLNHRLSAAAEAQFFDIVQVMKSGSVLVEDHGEPLPLPIQSGFDSFDGRNQSMLRDWLWETQGKNFFDTRPEAPLSDAVIAELYAQAAKELGSYTKCVIFNNGDIACFKVPFMRTAEAPYVNGTAVDRDGNMIPGAGYGGGGFGAVRINGSTSRYGRIGYSSHGALWLFCAFVNGKLDHCWVEWMPE